MTARWFEVDRDGLRQLLEARGAAFVLYELLANAWDAPGTTQVAVVLEPLPGLPCARLSIIDDAPDGFANLAHAWTLFAESNRKGDPASRGRWNLGEKLVLSLCKEAEISTTSGGVRFDVTGRHLTRNYRRDRGSEFRATLRCTRAQHDEIVAAALRVVPPAGIATTFNGTALVGPAPVRSFIVELPTEYADAEGVLRRSRRQTTVEVLETLHSWVYELGIPVQEIGDRWSYNVRQKVPLTVDRTAVTSAFLRELRVAVLNQLADELTEADATAEWVRDAAGDERAAPAAVTAVMQQRFGERAVAYDPSDPEGTKIAMSQGYIVVSGGALSAGEWRNVKAAGVLRPAGQVTPSPQPYGDGPLLKLFDPAKWTPDMVRIVALAQRLAGVLFGHPITVQIAHDASLNAGATYGPSGTLVFNLMRLAHAFFARPNDDEEVLGLILHEFAHETVRDHLSDEYHKTCCQLGARLAVACVAQPDLLRGAK